MPSKAKAKPRAAPDSPPESESQSQSSASSGSSGSVASAIGRRLRLLLQHAEKAGVDLAPDFDWSTLAKGHVSLFSPRRYTDRDQDAQAMMEMVAETSRNKVSARVFRLIGVLFVPLTILVLIAAKRESLSVNFMFGNALLCMFTAYFVHIFAIFYSAAPGDSSAGGGGGGVTGSSSAKATAADSDGSEDEARYLFRVYSVNSIIPDCTSMSVCYRALMFKYQPITSISEFSAIQGGIAQSMLQIISSYSWVVLLCAMAPELHEHGFSALSLGDVCEFAGCFGLVMIGTFELDPWNRTMQRFHNAGAVLGSLTLVGFLYQQVIIFTHERAAAAAGVGAACYLRVLLPVVMMVVAGVAFAKWSHYSAVAGKYDPIKKNDGREPETEEEKEEIRRTVNRISMQNVISEAIVLYCGSVAMCLWLVYFDTCHDVNFCRP